MKKMSQNHSDGVQRQRSQKQALGFAFDRGVLTGTRMGIISGLICFLLLFWNSETWVCAIVKSLLLLALIGGWPVIPVLCGACVAKKTGRGAGIGAYSGLFLGPISVVLTIISTFISMVIFYQLVPQTWAFAFSGGDAGGAAEVFALGVVPVAVICAFPASFGVGPLLGALGGGIALSRTRTGVCNK
jgi:hypothetical protein